jgi:hypothetical protein
MSLVVILPASNEEDYLGPCLEALRKQRDTPPLYVIVSANGCSDGTVAVARDQVAAFASRGYALICLDNPVPDKTAALNRAEAAIPSALANAPRVYLDADVICAPDICAQLSHVLDTKQPSFATGRLVVSRSPNAITRLYAAAWMQTPFGRSKALGAGLFGVNATGRRRWQQFPATISDDTLVRWSFAPHERVEVPAKFYWPMAAGPAALIRVRSRQDHLVQQVRARFPELECNEDVQRPNFSSLATLALRQPLAFVVYYAVCLAARLRRKDGSWARGR